MAAADPDPARSLPAPELPSPESSLCSSALASGDTALDSNRVGLTAPELATGAAEPTVVVVVVVVVLLLLMLLPSLAKLFLGKRRW